MIITSSSSRRTFLKSTGLSLAGLSLPSLGVAQEEAGKASYPVAPELKVPQWIDGQGKSQAPFSIAANRGKWIYLKCFQDWCPACHSVGFPNLQKLVEAFPDDSFVSKAVIQTTFEGFHVNTHDALRKNQLNYNLSLPFGHDPGNDDLPRSDANHYPKTMVSYQTRGTPWVIVINPSGQIVFSDVHINMDKLIEHLQKLS